MWRDNDNRASFMCKWRALQFKFRHFQPVFTTGSTDYFAPTWRHVFSEVR
jgi:hypothetical protein